MASSLGKMCQRRMKIRPEGGQLGGLGPELVGDQAPPRACGLGVLLGEGGGEEGRHHAPALAAGMGEQFAHEVHAAALGGCAENPGNGRLQPLVVFGDHIPALSSTRVGLGGMLRMRWTG